MNTAATLDHVPQAALDELVRRAADVAGFPIAWLSFVERERESGPATVQLGDARYVERTGGLSGLIVQVR